MKQGTDQPTQPDEALLTRTNKQQQQRQQLSKRKQTNKSNHKQFA